MEGSIDQFAFGPAGWTSITLDPTIARSAENVSYTNLAPVRRHVGELRSQIGGRQVRRRCRADPPAGREADATGAGECQLAQ